MVGGACLIMIGMDDERDVYKYVPINQSFHSIDSMFKFWTLRSFLSEKLYLMQVAQISEVVPVKRRSSACIMISFRCLLPYPVGLVVKYSVAMLLTQGLQIRVPVGWTK